MELFDESTDNFKEIQSKFTKLQEEQQKRITPNFKDEENRQLDRSISQLFQEITKKIKKSDENIKKLASIQLESFSEQSMKDNIKIYLATRLQEISKKVRQNEEEYMNKYKEFCSNDDPTNRNAYNSGDRFDNSNNKSQPNSFLEFDKGNDILKQRDNEINNLVKSIGELAQVFQDLSVLVHEQGTILDRIDVNIEASLENTKKANKHLLQTEKNIESGCARNSIIILIVVIFVQALLLLLKFANK